SSPGVGVLRSMDGGRTWVVLDSSNNVDDPRNGFGNISPIAAASRDRVFFSTTTYKIIVDPTAVNDADKDVVVDLAGGGNGGGSGDGVWRSTDTGRHWTRIRQGSATDIVLAAGSGAPGTGLLQTLYAGFRSEGVFIAQPAFAATSMTLLTANTSGFDNGSFI